VLGHIQAESHFFYSAATNRILPLHSQIVDGHPLVGGCDTVDLAEQYGTPLYVYDELGLEEECAGFARAMSLGPEGSRGLYALKAFPAVAMAALAHRSGLGLLCASGGEVAVARAAGVPADDVVLHGNNKSDAELRCEVRRLIVDSIDEIERLGASGISADAWLRVAPGLDAGGHEFIRTGGVDTKFGVGLGQAVEAAKRLAALPTVRLRGLHAHIGSQVFGTDQHVALARLMVPLAAEVEEATGVPIKELDLGGGFAIAYTREDPAVASPSLLTTTVLREWPSDIALTLEPGRALVARAGVSLHRIGTVKEVPGIRTYVSVDGGMSDNIRPALYGARYEFLAADRADAPAEQVVRLVGKHCESGDILAPEAWLPADPRPGEILVTLATGAYAWAMSSNYNQLPRPAVVFCRDGRSRVVIRRETVEDLVRRNEPEPSGPHPAQRI
jgi:diaminopimelate decarboxylase